MNNSNRHFKRYEAGDTVTVKFKSDNTANADYSVRYTITGILGEGGNSVVYNVKEDNGKTSRRLKTFNPYIQDEQEINVDVLKKILAEEEYKSEIFSDSQYAEKLLENYKQFKNTIKIKKRCVPDDISNMIPGILSEENEKIEENALCVFVSDPHNDITLKDYFSETKKEDLTLNKLVDITISCLKFTKILRDNHAVHFDIKDSNIIINKLTGDFLEFIDYESARVKGVNDDENFRLIATHQKRCELSPGYIMKLNSRYDIYCILIWFQEKMEELGIEYDERELKNTIDFINKVEKGSDSKNYEIYREIINCDVKKIYISILDELIAIDAAGWQRLKSYCKNKYVNHSPASDNSSFESALLNAVTLDCDNTPFSIDSYCGWVTNPIVINCDFYEERKFICGELAKSFMNFRRTGFNKEVIAAPITINSSMRTMHEIKNAIASATMYGKTFSQLCHTLAGAESAHQLILIINLRTYSTETITKLSECLNELRCSAEEKHRGASYSIFNFIIVTGKIYEQSSDEGEFQKKVSIGRFFTKDLLINDYSGMTYSYKFDKIKSELQSENDCTKRLEEFKNAWKLAVDKKMGNKILSLYHLNKLKNLSTIDPREINSNMSAFNLVSAALGGFSAEKTMEFAKFINNAFKYDELNTGTNTSLQRTVTKGHHYHAPLTAEDIILVAERTGIINIVGIGVNSRMRIEVGNLELINELFAQAVFEKFSTLNSSNFEQLYLSQPLNENVCNMIQQYLSNDREAIKRFKEYCKKNDPIQVKWKYGNGGLKRTQLNRKETYTAINFRLINKNLDDGYTDETGHYVKLDETVEKKYTQKNDDKSKWGNTVSSILNDIKKNQKRCKWAKKTIIGYIAYALCVVLLISLTLVLWDTNEKKKVDYDRSIPISIFRTNSFDETYRIKSSEKPLFFNDDDILVPVTNGTLLTEKRLNSFEFESEEGDKFGADFINMKYTGTNGVIYVTLRINEGAFNNQSKKPIHITKINNTVDNESLNCDFYIAHRDYAVQVSFEQLPSVANESMEFLIKFSCIYSPFKIGDPENLNSNEISVIKNNIYIGDGTYLINPTSVEKMDVTDDTRTYKIRINDLSCLNHINPENGTRDLRIIFNSSMVMICTDGGINLAGACNMDFMGSLEKENYTTASEIFKDGLMQINRSQPIKFVKSNNPISADIIKSDYVYTTHSATNAKEIVFEPLEKMDSSYYINIYKDNTVKVDGISVSNMKKYKNVIFSYLGYANNDGMLNFEAVLSNAAGQSGSSHIKAENIGSTLKDNGYDNTAPSVQLLDYTLGKDAESGKDMITIKLLKSDDYPLAFETLSMKDILVYGANYNANNVNFNISSTYAEESGQIYTNRQYTTITILVEEYYGDPKENLSVLIDCSNVADAAGNKCGTKTIAVGIEPIFSAPYTDAESGRIAVDVTFPYSFKQNLTEGHIGVFNDIGVTVGYPQNVSTNPYTRTIYFENIDEYNRLRFTINSGYGINRINGSLAPRMDYDFRSDFCVTKCRRFGDTIQAELIFNENVNMSTLNVSDFVSLTNGENKIDSGLSYQIMRNRLIITLTNFAEIPTKLIFHSGLAAILGSTASYTGYAEADIETVNIVPSYDDSNTQII